MDLSECAVGRLATISRHPWELARRSFVERMVRSLRGQSPQAIGRILDVGCGDAFITSHLSHCHADLRVDGVDTALSHEIVPRIAGSGGKLHLVPSMALLDREAGPIGLILVLDVLEHVPDDVSFLRSIVGHPLVDSRAHFLITVPAFSFLYCSHDRLLGHHRRYRFGQLKRVAAAADLAALEGGYLWLSGFWVRAVQWLLEKLHLVLPLQQTQVSCWHAERLETRLCQNLLELDLAVSRFLAKAHLRLPGLSCYLICRKRG